MDSEDSVLYMFDFRYGFQTDGSDGIENVFPILNVILLLQNLLLLLSCLYSGRNSCFSKQSTRDVLQFLILKMRENSLLY